MKNYLFVFSLLVFFDNSGIAGLKNLPSLLKEDTNQIRRTKRESSWQEALQSLKRQPAEQTDLINPLSKFAKEYQELLQGRAFKIVLFVPYSKIFLKSKKEIAAPEYFSLVVKDANNYLRVEFVNGKQVLGEILE